MLVVKDAKTQRVLIERGRTFSDGRTSQENRLPGLNRRPNENVYVAARRLALEVLKLDERSVRFRLKGTTLLEEERGSTDYPGLPTKYRWHVVKARFGERDADASSSESSSDEDEAKRIKRHAEEDLENTSSSESDGEEK